MCLCDFQRKVCIASLNKLDRGPGQRENCVGCDRYSVTEHAGTACMRGTSTTRSQMHVKYVTNWCMSLHTGGTACNECSHVCTLLTYRALRFTHTYTLKHTNTHTHSHTHNRTYVDIFVHSAYAALNH